MNGSFVCQLSAYYFCRRGSMTWDLYRGFNRLVGKEPTHGQHPVETVVLCGSKPRDKTLSGHFFCTDDRWWVTEVSDLFQQGILRRGRGESVTLPHVFVCIVPGPTHNFCTQVVLVCPSLQPHAPCPCSPLIHLDQLPGGIPKKRIQPQTNLWHTVGPNHA